LYYSVVKMKRIYLDTSILRHIGRIANEATGWDYGDYEWVYRYYGNKLELVCDVKALCYIIALLNEWDLDFCASDASYAELCKSVGERASQAREAWELFVETQTNEKLKRFPIDEDKSLQGQLFNLGAIQDRLRGIDDLEDREILRDFLKSGADVLGCPHF